MQSLFKKIFPARLKSKGFDTEPSLPCGKRRKVHLAKTRKNKNRLCSKTCGGYEILVTKVIGRNYFNLSKIEQQLDQECWIPP